MKIDIDAQRQRAVGWSDWLGLFVSLLKRLLPCCKTLRSGGRALRIRYCAAALVDLNGSGRLRSLADVNGKLPIRGPRYRRLNHAAQRDVLHHVCGREIVRA